MHPDEGFHDHAGTVMVIAWGQFMDHDFTLTGTPLGKTCSTCFIITTHTPIIIKRINCRNLLPSRLIYFYIFLLFPPFFSRI